jgi:YVTN family beta-propeller protein/uncharacterized repeat protein (TIGR03803 family)
MPATTLTTFRKIAFRIRFRHEHVTGIHAPSRNLSNNYLRRLINRATRNRSWISGICGRTATTALALAIMLVLAVLAIGSAQAQTFTTLASFDLTNGAHPYYMSLVQGTDGNFYGPTTEGGANGDGTLFRITPSGTLNWISFDGTDGNYPLGSLVQGTNGDFYGTTNSDGANGAGTVFESTPDGSLTTLYNFCSQSGCVDGGFPVGALVQAASGDFYGTAAVGGAYGGGTIFRMTASGALTTLYSFCSQANCGDGSYPLGGLVQAADGNFYGTTQFGGTSSNCSGGCGTIFEITSSGMLTVLHSFDSNDGAYPNWLVQASDGNFYGTNSNGGLNNACSGGCGTAFSITPAGTLTTLYNFCSQPNCSDGYAPDAGLVQATDGNFYGTTWWGGANGNSICAVGCGTIFRLTSAGILTTLYNFCSQANCTDGARPEGLVQGTNGTLYGTTGRGGTSGNCTNGCGTVFSLSVGVSPGPFAYVANMNDDTVSVINIPNSSVVNTIPVGSAPSGVAVSPDQTQVYVSNNHGNSVSVINTASSSVVATVPVQSSPFGVAFTPDGTAAYVANSASNSVSVINTSSQTVVATVPVQSSPVGVAMALTSNGTFAYVTNEASDSVSVIAVASNTVVQTIPVGPAPRWVAVSPNSSLAYVSNSGSGTISVISIATNTVTATIPVGSSPFGVAFTPDSSLAYVANSASNTVSVIGTASGSLVTTVPGFDQPVQVVLTADGSSAYVTNQNANNVSVIATATNTITRTVGVGSAPIGVAIASAPPTELQITMQLNETEPTQFNFGPHNFTVQYPPGTSFPPVNMTVAAAQTTQATYQQSVAGTQFKSSACIVYLGAGGNCVDYKVTCSDLNGNPVPCPSEPMPNISVKTSYDTQQSIINPGFLTAPIGSNQFQNIFSQFYLQRIDPTTKGFTKGFSQFYAVDLGAGNAQGAGIFTFLAPLLPTDPRVFGAGVEVPVEFQLMSITNPTKPITDAVASLTVVMTSNASGSPESNVVLAKKNAFQYQGGGDYLYQMNTAGFADGTYILTVYGNAFAAQQVQFTIQKRAATTCVITPSSSGFYEGQPITFTVLVQPKPPATGTPTGSITVQDNAYSQLVLGTASLVGGEASITAVLQAPPDRQFVRVVYPGDNNFKACESRYITMNYLQSQ